MDMRKKLLGAEHPDTLLSIENLASTYKNWGRLNQVELLKIQVMDMRKKAEHPDTPSSLANLAGTDKTQGRQNKAEHFSNSNAGGVITPADHHQLLVGWVSGDGLNEVADQSNETGMCIPDMYFMLTVC